MLYSAAMPSSIVILENRLVMYKRARSSVWQVRVKLDNGDWHRTTTKQTDLDDAQERALEIYYEARERSKNKLPQASRRFSNVAKMAIQQMEDELKHGNGKVVYKAYLSALNNLLIPYFGKMNIDNITPAKIQSFEIYRIEALQKEPAASTITNHNSALNRVFELAIQHGWATRNLLPKLKNKGRKSNVRPTFSFAEYRLLVRRMREWAKTGRTDKTRMMRELLRDYVLILANTGIRHGTEALNMKWKDVDWFVNTKNERYVLMTVDGKTGNRQLIARHNCEIYLKRIKNRFEALKNLTLDEIFKQQIDEHVFRLEDGSRTDNLHQSFEQLLRDTELMYGTTSTKRRTLYSLRHFYATFQLCRGRSIHQLAIQMGTSVAMLEQHYSKLTPMLMADEFAGERRNEKDVWI